MIRGPLALCCLPWLPSLAGAHVSVQTTELIAGGLHPWINLDSALVLVGLTLWLAQSATSTELRPSLVMGLAVAAGMAGGLFSNAMPPPALISGIALLVGLGVALRLQPALFARAFTTGCLAAVAGYYAGIDAAPDVQSPLAFTAGALGGALVVPLAAGILLGERDSRVIRTGIRVIGSWLAAVGLMLCALRLRR